MKKFSETKLHSNDVPVIFLYDDKGRIIDKISVNQWKEKKKKVQLLEELDIKLYRTALDYYANQEFLKAEDLLLYLIEGTAYTHYEYVERLANIYHQQKRVHKEKNLLVETKKQQGAVDSESGILQRIDKRLLELENKQILSTNCACFSNKI